MDEYAPPDRASRQAKVVDQERLEDTSVRVIGSDVAADLIHLGLIGLSVGSVVREEQGSLFDKLGLDVAELNYFQEQQKQGRADYTLATSDRYAIEEDTIFVPSNNNYFSGVVAGRSLNALVNLVEGKPAPLRDDCFSGLEQRVSGEVLVVGAGGTGTYTALSALLAGYDVCVVDQDVIETSNFNRQVLYGGRQGAYKAQVLAERLSPLGNVRGVIGLIQEQEELLHRYKDKTVFSCVDNTDARIYLDEQRAQARYTLIDTGTGPRNGRVHVADDTSLQDQVVLIPEKKTSCVTAAPSVVMPNMIVGSLAVHQAMNDSHSPLLYKGLTNEVVE